ncbi:MAG TPA: preprotein translocase subunit YajC [Xanthobacteraceae bacterium]
MLFTPAYAQFGSLGAGGANSMIIQFMPLILIIVIMYFLILRPQQRKVKMHQDLVKALRRGDTVITNGGLIGKVTKVVDDNHIEIEISDGVRVRHLRSSVSEVRAKSEPVKEDSTS